MQFSTRRTVLKGAGSVALSSLPYSSAFSRSAAGTIFMVDAVSELRARLGMRVHRSPSGAPTWMPGEEKSHGSQGYDPRLPMPITKTPEALGGVGVPVAFADFDFWYVTRGISWYPNAGQKLPEVQVPHGFCCDLSTIPQFFWSFGLPKIGRYAYAAIIHDYLYWHQAIATREQADEILYTAMVDSGVAAITREAINFAVSKVPFFAQNAWDRNAELKTAGAKRILKVTPPHDKLTTWADWSKDPSHFSD